MPINWIMLYELGFCQFRSFAESGLDQFPSLLAPLVLGHNHERGLDFGVDAMKPGMATPPQNPIARPTIPPSKAVVPGSAAVT